MPFQWFRRAGWSVSKGLMAGRGLERRADDLRGRLQEALDALEDSGDEETLKRLSQDLKQQLQAFLEVLQEVERSNATGEMQPEAVKDWLSKFFVADLPQRLAKNLVRMEFEAKPRAAGSARKRDDSDDDDDDLDVEIAWKRQFTAGSSASTASSSASANASNASKAARWEKAQALAEDVAQKLRMTMPCVLPSAPSVEKEPEIPEVEEYEEVEGPISHASRFEVRPVGAGAPPANLLDLHDEVLKSAGRATSQAKKWRNRRYKINQPALYPCEEFVSPKSEEYDVVTRYFETTLGQRCSIQSLTRLPAPQEAASRRAFRTDGDHTVMFHGCRSEVNERNIVTNGFRVSSCLSGGRNFGTWFAYKADYSNIGYAFDDRKGWRHIFICVVSYYHTVLDNGTMRVVGQGCAYPQWLLRYKLQPLPCPTPAAAPAAAPVRPPAAVTRGNERTWYVVRNGKWELEKT